MAWYCAGESCAKFSGSRGYTHSNYTSVNWMNWAAVTEHIDCSKPLKSIMQMHCSRRIHGQPHGMQIAPSITPMSLDRDFAQSSR
eukprot:841970-Amphidinium_carterae.2